jgi:hypothetical protein
MGTAEVARFRSKPQSSEARLGRGRCPVKQSSTSKFFFDARWPLMAHPTQSTKRVKQRFWGDLTVFLSK